MIDAFGTGDFIAALTGDSLYAESVVKTGFESKAELMLESELFTVPSDMAVRVDSLIQSQQKQKRTRWFPSLIRTIGRMVSSTWKKEESEVLGGRAAKSESDAVSFWVTEDDTLLIQARELIEASDYSQALTMLDAIQFTPEDALPGEVPYLQGHALYSLHLYEDALPFFLQAKNAIESSGFAQTEIPFRSLLLFEQGSALYFMGDYGQSKAILERLLSMEPGDMEPYAQLMLCVVLKDAGNSAESQHIAAEALEKYRGTQFESEFLKLSKPGE